MRRMRLAARRARRATAAEGGCLINPAVIASVLNGRRRTDGVRDRLTFRERQVLRLMSEGASNREIAGRLGISYTTVRSHLRNVAGKLSAHSKLEILVKAQRLEMVARAETRYSPSSPPTQPSDTYRSDGHVLRASRTVQQHQ